jgi:hypothetical protein
LRLLLIERQAAQRAPLFEVGLDALQQRQLARFAAVLAEPRHALLDHLEIGEDRLGLEVADLPQGIRGRSGGVGEAAHHLAEGVDAAHGVERGAFDPRAARSGQIGERDLRVGRLLGLVDRGERIHPLVGHLDDAEIRLVAARAEAGLDGEPGERSEDGALSAARKADQSDLHGAAVTGGRRRRR